MVSVEDPNPFLETIMKYAVLIAIAICVPKVALYADPKHTEKFSELTRENVGKNLALIQSKKRILDIRILTAVDSGNIMLTLKEDELEEKLKLFLPLAETEKK